MCPCTATNCVNICSVLTRKHNYLITHTKCNAEERFQVNIFLLSHFPFVFLASCLDCQFMCQSFKTGPFSFLRMRLIFLPFWLYCYSVKRPKLILILVRTRMVLRIYTQWLKRFFLISSDIVYSFSRNSNRQDLILFKWDLMDCNFE